MVGGKLSHKAMQLEVHLVIEQQYPYMCVYPMIYSILERTYTHTHPGTRTQVLGPCDRLVGEEPPTAPSALLDAGGEGG